MKVFTSVTFAFLILFSLSSLAFSVSPKCEKEVGDVSSYMKVGMPADTPPEKIYRFLKIRDDLGEALTTEPGKADCLSKIYKAGMEEEADYWAKRLPEGCEVDNSGNFQGTCDADSEAVKSTKFIETLQSDIADEAAALKEASDAVKAEDASGGPACPAAAALSPAQTLAQATDVLCCGSKAGGGGAVRGVETELSYADCLTKTRPSKFTAGGFAYGAGACAVNGAWAAIKQMFSGFTAIYTVGSNLWGARAQIYSLLTDRSVFSKFMTKIGQMVQGLLRSGKDNVNAILNCYNGYEGTQYTCKLVGDVIGLCAAPSVFGQFISIVGKPLAAAATGLKDLLAASKGGQLVLKGGAKVAAGSSKLARAGNAATTSKLGEAAAAKGVKAAALAKGLGRTVIGKTPANLLKGAAKLRQLAAGTGSAAVRAGKALERVRKFIARHTYLSAVSEKIAKSLITDRGYYKKLLAAAYRAEKAGKVTRSASLFAGAVEKAEPVLAPRASMTAPASRGAPAKPADSMHAQVDQHEAAGKLTPAKAGSKVLIQQPTGGYAEATVVRKTADGTVRVQWTKNGKTITRGVKPENLRRSFAVQDRVQVPTAAGRLTDATIVAKSDRAATVMWTEDGKNVVKSVPLSDLRAADSASSEVGTSAATQILSLQAPVEPQSVFTPRASTETPSVTPPSLNFTRPTAVFPNWRPTAADPYKFAPKSILSQPRASARNPASVEAQAEKTLGRSLNDKEVEAVRKAHEICGEAEKSGVFSYPCRFRKTRACMKVLSKNECKTLLDKKILGSFPETARPGSAVERRDLDAELDELSELERWSQDFQTSRSLRAEDRVLLTQEIDRAMEELGNGKSARQAIDGIREIRTRAASRTGESGATSSQTASLDSLAGATERLNDPALVSRLQPGVSIEDLASPGISKVTLRPEVVKFLKEQPQERSLKFLRAIQRGFTAPKGSSGIVRYNSVTKNFVEVKVLAQGVKQRLIGCVHNGTLELMAVFEKHGNDTANYSKYAHICD